MGRLEEVAEEEEEEEGRGDASSEE